MIVERVDEHRHRVAVEQQAERGFALFHLGDVDAQADNAAVAGAPLLDQDTASVGQALLVPAARVVETLEPFGDPFFLTADRFRIVAAGDADAQRVLQARARLEQVSAAPIDVGVLLVPQDVAPLRVEEDDALRQDVDRVAQPLVGFPRLRNRS